MAFTPSGPIEFASNLPDPPCDWIPLTIGSTDLDLSAPNGPTSGYSAKGLFVAGAGVVCFYCIGIPKPGQSATLTVRTVTVPNNSIIPGKIVGVGGSTTGTTASGIQALV